MLKDLFEKTLPNYYKQVGEAKTLVHLESVETVIEDARKRIRQRKIEASNVLNIEAVAAYELALIELSFYRTEIIQEQFKSLDNE
mgnify:FL=1|tara:strand:- start:383 stop:637 length:255 start_codon:yes stop_codon:yes gene_type:complete